MVTSFSEFTVQVRVSACPGFRYSVIGTSVTRGLAITSNWIDLLAVFTTSVLSVTIHSNEPVDYRIII